MPLYNMITDLIVEHRRVQLPDAWVGDPNCVQAEDCCGDPSGSDCCDPDTIPQILYATIYDATNECSCWNEITFVLTNELGTSRWISNTIDYCGDAMQFDIYCPDPAEWSISGTLGGCSFDSVSDAHSCGPTEVEFHSLSGGVGCCDGNFKVMVFE